MAGRVASGGEESPPAPGRPRRNGAAPAPPRAPGRPAGQGGGGMPRTPPGARRPPHPLPPPQHPPAARPPPAPATPSPRLSRPLAAGLRRAAAPAAGADVSTPIISGLGWRSGSTMGGLPCIADLRGGRPLDAVNVSLAPPSFDQMVQNSGAWVQ